MTDLPDLDAIRERFQGWGAVGSHWEDCWKSHPHCAIAMLCDEVERLRDMLDKSESLVQKHAAELNRRRGAASVAKQLLTEYGIPSERNGVTMSLYQRLKIALENRDKPETPE